MDIHATAYINAPRPSVWAALNDPVALAQCLEGCTRLEWVDPHQMVGQGVVKIGPMQASFQGSVHISDVIVGERYTLTGEGKGGVAGFAKGSADMTLADAPEGGTRITYVVKLSVGGKLAQLGARLIDSTARAYADQFFSRLTTLLESNEAISVAPGAADEIACGVVSMEPHSVAPEESAKGLPAWIWISTLIIGTFIVMWGLLNG